MENMQELYDARLKRVSDAVRLKEPDRIPIVPVFQAYPVYFTKKWNIQDIMYGYRKASDIYDAFYSYYKPDMGWDPILFYPANYMECSGITWFKWPGNQIKDPNIWNGSSTWANTRPT